jgi:hypothetical protein
MWVGAGARQMRHAPDSWRGCRRSPQTGKQAQAVHEPRAANQAQAANDAQAADTAQAVNQSRNREQSMGAPTSMRTVCRSRMSSQGCAVKHAAAPENMARTISTVISGLRRRPVTERSQRAQAQAVTPMQRFAEAPWTWRPRQHRRTRARAHTGRNRSNHAHRATRTCPRAAHTHPADCPESRAAPSAGARPSWWTARPPGPPARVRPPAGSSPHRWP